MKLVSEKLQINPDIKLMQKFETIGERYFGDFRIFKVYMKQRKNPETGKINDYAVLDSPNWVNIIPVTRDKKIVLVEQYRHGTDSITLEIPGGLRNPGEDPADGAARECMEETGYSSTENPVQIGVSRPNPAYQNNFCHSFVWFNCEQNLKPEPDANEIIKIHAIPVKEVFEMAKNGTIDHSVILTALFYYALKYGTDG